MTETLYVDRNLLSGNIPSEFGNLNLIELQAYKNQLGGAIPDVFWNNHQLTGLRLDLNIFVGTISTRIGELTNLTDLRFSNNAFSGTLPASISKLSNLGKFSIVSSFAAHIDADNVVPCLYHFSGLTRQQ
jgi:Leucine-rich repeat (LRR) protein